MSGDAIKNDAPRPDQHGDALPLKAGCDGAGGLAPRFAECCQLGWRVALRLQQPVGRDQESWSGAFESERAEDRVRGECLTCGECDDKSLAGVSSRVAADGEKPLCRINRGGVNAGEGRGYDPGRLAPITNLQIE